MVTEADGEGGVGHRAGDPLSHASCPAPHPRVLWLWFQSQDASVSCPLPPPMTVHVLYKNRFISVTVM